MKKRMVIMIIALIIIFGGVFGWDALRSYFMKQYFAHYQPPPATISTVVAKKIKWQATLDSVGTLVAVNGVTLSPEVSGIVTDINFHSGQYVEKGTLLIQLDDSVDQADLKSAEAALQLAKLSFNRTDNLYQRRVASQSEYDSARATLQQDEAAVEKIKALIAEKHITAPFAGRLGIREVNIGQYVSPGTALVSLQAVSPIYVNFYLPEQNLPNIKVGQTVEAKVDTYPSEKFTGSISAINSHVDTTTHNVLVQATFPNKQHKLYPGLFANISVLEPDIKDVVIVPVTAITMSLFGDSAYVIETPQKPEKTKSGQDIYTVKQVFVKLGASNGKDIIITSGISDGDKVVSSGQLKLENGSRVVINNSVNLNKPQDEIH